MEFVRQVDDIVGAHQRVIGMNFIPGGGYKMSTAVCEACVEAESQLVASGAGEIETELPSPAYDDDFRYAQHIDLPPSLAEQDLPLSFEDEDQPPSPADDDLPPTHPDEVHNLSPHQDASCLPAQETLAVQNDESPPARDRQTLKVDIRIPPPSKELIQRVTEILKAPQSTSKGVRPEKKKVTPSSPPAPMQEDHSEDELSPPCELRSKIKQDKWPRKKPRGYFGSFFSSRNCRVRTLKIL